MPILGGSSNRTVRQGSSWTMPWGIYFLVFMAAAGAAYWRTSVSQESASAAASATAKVRVREPGGAAAAEAAKQRTRPMDPERVRQQIGALAGDSIREGLRVETIAGSAPGELNISIGVPHKPQYEAAPTANALAQAFATAYRAQWRTSAEQSYRDAHETAGRAQQLLHDAKLRLESMLDRQAQTAREAAARAAAARAVARRVESTGMADNPDWVEQNRQLIELRQRRRELLTERTPLHPAVQDIDNRILQVEHQLATLPRQIPAGPGAAAPASVPSEAEEQATTAASAATSQADIQRLQQTVEQAAGVQDDAMKAEQQAWQMRLIEPTVEIELASVQAESSTRPVMSALLAALAVGMTMVTGLGMVSTAIAIEPAAATIGQIQRALPVPVVGVVPSLTPNPVAIQRAKRQRWIRVMLVIAGLAVVLGIGAWVFGMGIGD